MKPRDLVGYRRYSIAEIRKLPSGTIFNHIKKGRCYIDRTMGGSIYFETAIRNNLYAIPIEHGVQFFGPFIDEFLLYPMILIACSKNCDEENTDENLHEGW